jgi:N-acetylglucosamine-6-phosphate deacetylase
VQALLSVASRLLLHGVTAFCPTIITSEPRTYQAVLPNMRRRRGSARCAEVLGAHLEGPFISDSKYGAHPLALVRSPAQGFESLLQCYGSLENVAIVTIAPELKGALEAVRKLRKSGVVVSAGHSMASLREAEAAVEAGVTMITHLYNAMQPFHHRDPGLIGLLARTQSLIYYGIIADGIHSNPASVRMAFLTSREGAMIVTDAVPAMGLPEGRYRLGKQDIEILKDRVVVAGTETLAGSVANMSESVRNYLRFTGCSIAEALEAASLHPARALGIEARKGSLDFGCDADMVVLDDSLALKAVFCGGELAWMSEGALKFIRPEDEGRLLARPAPLPSPSPPPLSSSQPIDSLLAPPPAPACAGSLPLVRGSSQI